MKAAGVKLNDISAAAKNMPTSDLKVLIKALSDEVRAKEAKTDKEAVRLQKLQAAMQASVTDESAKNLLKNVRDELRRLGLPNDLNAAASKGGYSLAEVDKALKQSDFQVDRKVAFKNKLDWIGLLDY
jgi:ribosomal protein L20